MGIEKGGGEETEDTTKLIMGGEGSPMKEEDEGMMDQIRKEINEKKEIVGKEDPSSFRDNG